jgi:RND family efflux transporter MFP subunit
LQSVNTARVALQTAQGNYDSVAWRPDAAMTTQASALQTAQADYNSAMANYRIAVAGVNDTALRTAQASLDKAQIALEQAKKNLDTSMRTAQASLDNAKTAVDTAQRNLENATLYAPFDGTVATVNYAVGDYANGTAITMVDLNDLQIKVSIAEVDMSRVKVGQTASVTLDALSGKTYTATVSAIGPVGTVSSGVVNYPVYLRLSNEDGQLRPGMTANLGIEVERRDNVLLVPARAVRTTNNQKMVSVMRDGKATPQRVATGLSNDTTVEIVNGLAEGDQIVIAATTSTHRGGGPIGGPGGPP